MEFNCFDERDNFLGTVHAVSEADAFAKAKSFGMDNVARVEMRDDDGGGRAA